MKLIVGLGNVGDRYADTRHNAGFMVVDGLANGKWGTDKKLQAITQQNKELDILLLKPTTMMNLSGQAVRAAMDYYKIPVEDVWVAYDDADLEFGKLRVRQGGSSGGQNGINSIIEHCGEGFWRFRVGVGSADRRDIDTARYVLSGFNSAERDALPELITAAGDLIKDALAEGPEHVSQTIGE